jgi:hypothetical protein
MEIQASLLLVMVCAHRAFRLVVDGVEVLATSWVFWTRSRISLHFPGVVQA